MFIQTYSLIALFSDYVYTLLLLFRKVFSIQFSSGPPTAGDIFQLLFKQSVSSPNTAAYGMFIILKIYVETSFLLVAGTSVLDELTLLLYIVFVLVVHGLTVVLERVTENPLLGPTQDLLWMLLLPNVEKYQDSSEDTEADTVLEKDLTRQGDPKDGVLTAEEARSSTAASLAPPTPSEVLTKKML